MPPKKTSIAASKKAPASAPAHPSYQDMIKEAIISLKDRQGSSRQALKKYVLANNKLDGVPEGTFTSQFNKALTKGTESGMFNRPKGASGTVKLAKPDAAAAKPAAEKKATTTKKTTTAAPKEKKAPAVKKTATKATTKKATATKKAATTKKATATKTAAKANTSKVRKTKAPAVAPAVEEKAPVVLTKTKTGRVVKSSQPQAEKKAPTKARKALAKRATPKKGAKKA